MNELRKLYEGHPNKVSFIDELMKFFVSRDPTLLSQAPIAEGKMVDLFELYSQSLSRGGFDLVTANKCWHDVALVCGIQSMNTAFQMYQKYLYHFEKSIKAKAPPLPLPIPLPAMHHNAQTQPLPVMMSRINSVPQVPSMHVGAPKYPVSNYPAPSTGLKPALLPNTGTLNSHPSQLQAQGGQYLMKRLNNGVQQVSTGMVPMSSASSTTAGPSGYMTQQTVQEKLLLAIKELDSTEISTVIRGLNFITQKSFDSEASGFSMEHFPSLVIALGDLLDTVNPMGALLSQKRELERPALSQSCLDMQSDRCWRRPIVLDDPLFKPTSEVPIACSAPIVRHLVVAVMTASGNCWSGCSSEASQLALDILVNVATKIDLTGRRRQQLQNYSWLEDCCSYEPKMKKQLRVRLSSHLSSQSLPEYLFAVESLVACMYSILQHSSERGLVLKSLDFFSRVAAVPDNASLFSQCPDGLLEMTVDYLCANTTVADPFSFSNPDSLEQLPSLSGAKRALTTGVNTHTSRLPASVSPFFSEFADTEIRDMALEVLFNITSSSSRMQVRVASISNLVPVLLKIIESTRPPVDRPGFSQRADVSTQKAAGILSCIGARFAVAAKFLSVETAICMDATVDDVVADIVCGNCMQFLTLGSSTSAAGIPIDPSEMLADESLLDTVL